MCICATATLTLMQPHPLSQAQCCLRLQSVYRAHRTRRCVTQRSRLEFERILADLEPEPSCSRVAYPLTFLCRPQIVRDAPPSAAIAPAAAVQIQTTRSSSDSSSVSSSVHATLLPFDRSEVPADASSSRAASAPASAPAAAPTSAASVSYTHLTLPTICSV